MKYNIFFLIIISLFIQGCSTVYWKIYTQGISTHEMSTYSAKFKPVKNMTCEAIHSDTRFSIEPQEKKLVLELFENTVYNSVDISKYRIGKNGEYAPEYSIGVKLNFGEITFFEKKVPFLVLNPDASAVILLVAPNGNLVYKNISGVLDTEIDNNILPVILTELECTSQGVVLSEPYFQMVR